MAKSEQIRTGAIKIIPVVGEDCHPISMNYEALACADLRHANLRIADLRRINFFNTNLFGADLFRANLTNTNFFNANLRSADLRNSMLHNTKFIDDTCLSNADFSHCDLRESIEISGTSHLEEAYLKYALIGIKTKFGDYDKLIKIQKSNLIFIFEDVETIKKVGFEIFVEEKPDGDKEWNTNIKTRNAVDHQKGTDCWTYKNILSQNLKDANLNDAYLPNLNFKGKDLSGITFNNADLRRCVFSGANICGVDFTDAKLDAAVLGGAIYDDTTKGLSEKQKSVMIHKDQLTIIINNVTNVIAPASDPNKHLALITDNTKIITTNSSIKGDPNGCLNITYGNIGLDQALEGHRNSMILKNSYFSNLDWTSTSRNFSKYNLSESDFRNTKFGATNLDGTNLSNSDLRGADLSSVQNLDKAILTGAKYNGSTKFPAGFNKNDKGMTDVSASSC